MSGRRRGFIAVIAGALALGGGVLALQAATGRRARHPRERGLGPLPAAVGRRQPRGQGKQPEARPRRPRPAPSPRSPTAPRASVGSQSTKSLVGELEPDLRRRQSERRAADRRRSALPRHRPARARQAQARQERVLSFQANASPGTSSVGLRTFADGGDAKAGGGFGRSTLFIDDGAAAATFGYEVDLLPDRTGYPRRTQDLPARPRELFVLGSGLDPDRLLRGRPDHAVDQHPAQREHADDEVPLRGERDRLHDGHRRSDFGHP